METIIYNKLSDQFKQLGYLAQEKNLVGFEVNNR